MSLFKNNAHRIPKSQIARYTGLFGSLFTGMKVTTNGKEVDVPIRFGNGHARNKIDKNLDSDETSTSRPKVKPVLPAMAFTLSSINPDETRSVVDHATITSRSLHKDGDTVMSMSAMSPNPYDIYYRLLVKANDMTEALLIFEQINSAFAKGVNVKFRDSEQLDVERTIAIRREPDLNIDDNFEDGLNSTREVVVEMTFVLKGYLYSAAKPVPVILNTEMLNDSFNWLAGQVDKDDLEFRLLNAEMKEND